MLEESPVKKGVVLLGGLAAAGAVLILAVVMVLHDPEPLRVREEVAKEKKSAPVPRGAVVSDSGALVRPPPPPPSEPVVRNDVKLSRAMDDSNARQLVRTLMQAAASENASLKASRLRALSRSPSARPILESELAKAGDPVVRTALQEALARTR